MAKIKRISKIKTTSTISRNLSTQRNTLKKEAKSFQNKNYKKPSLSLKDYLKQMKLIISIFMGGKLTVKNGMKYLDRKRYERMRKQLRVYFITAFRDGTFKFIVKSSGLSEPRAYKVDINFRNIDKVAKNLKAENKDVVLNTPIGIRCSCDDYRYRHAYWLAKIGASIGKKESRPPNITNANQEHKFLCKHCALVIEAVQKPSFYDNTFKRYIKNVRTKGKRNTVRVLKKDAEGSQRAGTSAKYPIGKS